MSNYRKSVLAAALMLIAALPSLGQSSEQIHFTISAPFKLRRSNVELPAGTYLLKLVGDSEHELFGLYSDPQRAPLAVIHTVPRDNYTAIPAPDKTEIVLDESQMSAGGDAILTGWELPGGQGWEVIGAVANEKRIEALSREGRAAEHRGSQ